MTLELELTPRKKEKAEMVKTHKQLLLVAVMAICIFSFQTAAYGQNVTAPSESTTPENNGPKPPSRGTRVLQTVIQALAKIICEEAGNCPPTADTPTESPSPEPQGFIRERRRMPAAPTHNSHSNFSFHTPQGYQAFGQQSSVTIAPASEYVNGNLSNGVILGLRDLNGANLETATDRYARDVLSANKYLRRLHQPESNVVNTVPCITTRLEGQSPHSGYAEKVVLYTCRRNAQKMFYVVSVNSGPNATRYEEENSRVIQSISFR